MQNVFHMELPIKNRLFAVNITFDDCGFPEFDVYSHNEFFDRIKLNVPGMHNVLNALACIALCTEYGIEKVQLKVLC